jgi:hypothetical protein
MVLEGIPAGEGSELAAVFATGTPGTGQYRCADCGYGITVCADLPLCPMCGSASWEAVPWAPFGGRGAVGGARRPPAAKL